MTIKNMNETNQETMANIAELKGRLAAAMRSGETFAIVKIPARLLTIDTAYQTPIRTERDLKYLTGNKKVNGEDVPIWDERKVGVLWGAPHWEEGKIYLVDGYGRLTASQKIDPVKYEELNVLVILDAPEDPKERQIFEAEIFMSQGNNKQVTPLQKHGARQVVGDITVKAMDLLKERYGFQYCKVKGRRGEGIIGSYSELYRSIDIYGYLFGEYFFDICAASGFNRKTDGYAVYVMRDDTPLDEDDLLDYAKEVGLRYDNGGNIIY